MMKTLNDYMAMSYRMEIVEDKEKVDLWFLIRICLAVLPVERLWKVR